MYTRAISKLFLVLKLFKCVCTQKPRVSIRRASFHITATFWRMQAREHEVQRQNAERQLQRLEELRECIICRDRPRSFFHTLPPFHLVR